MTWPEAALTFATGAGGALTLAKLLKFIQAKTEGRKEISAALFLNGEKERVIQALEWLKMENRQRAQENRDRQEEHGEAIREASRERREITEALQQILKRLQAAGL